MTASPWDPAKPLDDFAAREGIDPYLGWVLGAGWPHYDPAPDDEAVTVRIPLVLELADGVTAAEFAEGRGLSVTDKKRWKSSVRVPRWYTHPPRWLADASHCTAYVDAGFFARVDDACVTETVARLEIGRPVLGDVEVPEAASPLPAVQSGALALAGIIDDAIAFAHERFRITVEGQDAQGSRVESVWLQGAARGPTHAVPYGREIGKARIDALMADCTRAGRVDETRLYRRASAREPHPGRRRGVAHRRAHGTLVMDLAAGFDPAEAVTGYPIVAVQLPATVTADTSGGSLGSYVLDGLRHILERADAIAGTPASLPVVVNFSYGNYAGPHDGSSVFERALDELIALRSKAGEPLHVTVPAGNGHLTRTHARLELPTNGKSAHSLAWRILPDDATPSFVEIWLPPRGSEPPRFTVTVTPPAGASAKSLTEGGGGVARPGPGVRAFELREALGAGSSTGMFLVAVRPTRRAAPGGPVAPAGEWTVTIENTSSKPLTVDAWIERDDELDAFPRGGRQSFFDDADYLRYYPARSSVRADKGYRRDRIPIGAVVEVDPATAPSPVTRRGTINGLATGNEVIVVAGYDRTKLEPARYSASGPTRTGDVGVSVLAESDESPVRPGVLGAGSRSGTQVTMNGTSVAAPQVARQLLESFGPKTMTSTSDPPMTSASDPVSRIAGAGEAEIEQAARKSGDEAPKLATERAGKGRAIAPAGRRRRGQRDRRFGRVGPEGRR